MSIGQRIRERRKYLGLSQSNLAEKMGLKSKVSISTAENDKEDLTTTRVRRFAEALECSPGYLMGWEDAPEKLSFSDNKMIQEITKKLPMLTEEQQGTILNLIDLFIRGNENEEVQDS